MKMEVGQFPGQEVGLSRVGFVIKGQRSRDEQYDEDGRQNPESCGFRLLRLCSDGLRRCHLHTGGAVPDGIRQPRTRLISDGFAVLSELRGTRASREGALSCFTASEHRLSGLERRNVVLLKRVVLTLLLLTLSLGAESVFAAP